MKLTKIFEKKVDQNTFFRYHVMYEDVFLMGK